MRYKILLLVGLMTFFSSTIFAQINSRQWGTDNVNTISGTVTDNARPCGFIKADDGKVYKIHFGPVWYWDMNDYALALTTATIKGSIKELNGEYEIFPFTINQNNKTMIFADDKGVPKWTQGNGYGRGNGNGKGYCRGNGYGNGNGRGNCGNYPCRNK